MKCLKSLYEVSIFAEMVSIYAEEVSIYAERVRKSLYLPAVYGAFFH
jgi:hypothetical protein